ncbi:YciI family protein [Helicobacter burdigaliensis]|uniref:YciI family protein n=1 Tax=Helicobacter burdigaliensis TaxID=2315334 RepID=UPI000EF65394|nr:YciI family protein [Helicobacter burdigaliensis]
MRNLFLILVNYTKPLEVIDEILPAHREFLKENYKEGKLLTSGPREPRVGGIILGKFKDKEEALKFTRQDPFYQNQAASYEIMEFNPVLHDESLKNFLA